MSAHTIKGLREQFRAVGKFHTPPELALLLRSYIPGEPAEVYDPTCGAGALLSVFPNAEKYGQDIDAEALADASLLPRFHGVLGDVLSSPAWMDRKFPAIVANPPFSIKWDPSVASDERFMSAPTIPTANRADFAFLLHVLYMLASGGVAAVLSFPGVLYRGGRERTLRAWMIESNVIDRVVSIPGGTFEDTSISTAVIVFRKGRDSDSIVFEDREHGLEETVPIQCVRDADYSLSVSQFVELPKPDEPPFDAWEAECSARRGVVSRLRADLLFSRQVALLEGWPLRPFIDDLRGVLDEF